MIAPTTIANHQENQATTASAVIVCRYRPRIPHAATDAAPAEPNRLPFMVFSRSSSDASSMCAIPAGSSSASSTSKRIAASICRPASSRTASEIGASSWPANSSTATTPSAINIPRPGAEPRPSLTAAGTRLTNTPVATANIAGRTAVAEIATTRASRDVNLAHREQAQQVSPRSHPLEVDPHATPRRDGPAETYMYHVCSWKGFR